MCVVCVVQEPAVVARALQRLHDVSTRTSSGCLKDNLTFLGVLGWFMNPVDHVIAPG